MIYIIKIIFLVILFTLLSKKSKEKFTTNIELKRVTEPEDLRKGLMFIKKLDENKGMIFSYNESKIHSMWMKNTYIPLDVLFLDKNYKILGYVKNTKPFSTESISINKPSQHVVELNSGSIQKFNLKINDTLNFREINSF